MKPLHFTALALVVVQSSSFVVTPGRRTLAPSSSRLYVERDADGNIKKGPLEFIMDPKPTKIPPELKDEIYRAEGNTEAAKERQGRIFTYGIVATVLVFCAFGNVFLTELRSSVAEDTGATSLEDIGFGWVNANFLFQFLFSSKIGGAVCLLGGAGAGLMVEAEQDSGRKNAEEIWEELERRRASSSKKQQTKKRKKNKAKGGPPPSKKKQSGAQKKRLAALSEVVTADEEPAPVEEEQAVPTVSAEAAEPAKKDDGLMGKLKGWYDEADQMAASQALLMNKELEDRGVLDKITDESGLKVIGKDAASKLKEEGTSQSSDEKK